MGGPLQGTRIVEFAGLGPAPLAAMVFAGLGADVLRIARKGEQVAAADTSCRDRASIGMDLRAPGAAGAALELIGTADALIEGFRPGVMERLGLGPEACLARNPRLVYGRMTGWGQEGPLASTAGHDINYIALTGVLNAVGERGRGPVPPLNLAGDYGGGTMLLVVGMLAALHHAQRTGEGQVVDAAIVDGASLLATNLLANRSAGRLSLDRGDNALDGGAPWYTTYRCADDRYVAVGAIEPQFFQLLLERCGLPAADFADRADRARWPRMRERLAEAFARRTRDEWAAVFEGSDACVSPVLDWDEAPRHPHLRARGTLLEVDGIVQPAPAPRFSRTRSDPPRPGRQVDASDALAGWGLDAARIAALRGDGAI